MLVIILMIVLIILLIQYNGYEGFQGFKEGMKPRDKENKKGLLCYYGGAFREGHTGNSNQDTENGFDSQYYSTQSHLKLTKLIKEKGYDVDTIINTYHSTFEDKLSKWYNPYEILFNNINKNIKSVDGRDNLIQTSIKNIKSVSSNDYDFILFIRIDLFLKPDFYKVLNIRSEKIQFLADIVCGTQSSIQWNPNNFIFSKIISSIDILNNIKNYKSIFVFTHDLDIFINKFR
jgi:hypothetical protein